MDVYKLADFDTIKTAYGYVEAAFRIFFFLQGSLFLYNKDFLQCFIIHKSYSGIPMYCWANRIALSNISSNIDGLNSTMSNWINLHCDLFSIE